MKKLLSTVMATVLFIGIMGMPAKASESTTTQKYSEVPTEGVKSTNSLKGTGSVAPKGSTVSKDSSALMSTEEDTTLITFGECSIENLKNGYVRGYGKTVTGVITQEVGYTLYLQTWTGYEWKDTFSTTISKYNTTTASQYDTIPVQSGKYYRVKVDHYALNSITYNSLTSISSYIYVN